jgi:hypothetical protein
VPSGGRGELTLGALQYYSCDRPTVGKVAVRLSGIGRCFKRRGLQPASLRRTLAGGYSAEQPVRFAIDPVSEVEGVGTAVVAADPEIDRPKAARRNAGDADRKAPVKFAVDRVEGIDLAMEKAEVADQQMTGEPAETGRREGDPPRRGEAIAGNQFLNASSPQKESPGN